jgi:hypothetical protein
LWQKNTIHLNKHLGAEVRGKTLKELLMEEPVTGDIEASEAARKVDPKQK